MRRTILGACFGLIVVPAALGAATAERGDSLHQAVASGDVSEVRRQLDALRVEPAPGEPLRPPAGLEERDAAGATPLFIAVSGAHQAIAGLLLEVGANPNSPGPGGELPLLAAIEGGDTAMVRLLLGAGADPNAGRPRTFAMWGPDGEWASVEATEATPLHIAAARGESGSVAALIAKGADVGAKDEHGRTALHYGTAGSFEIAEYLLAAGAAADTTDANGVMPLIQAALQNNEGYARRLVEAGADINGRDANGRTALAWAALRSSESFARDQLSLGADPNFADNDGRTALHLAATSGLIAPLIDAGATVNVADDDGYSPLHLAIQKEDIERVKHLLSRGADLSFQSPGGPTALLLTDSAEMRALLLRKGANLNLPGPGGVRLIHNATARADLDEIRYLVRRGADVNLTLESGETPLHIASFHGNLEVVRFLLENGAEVGIENRNGHTALHHADFNGHREVVELLMQFGAENTPYELR